MSLAIYRNGGSVVVKKIGSGVRPCGFEALIHHYSKTSPSLTFFIYKIKIITASSSPDEMTTWNVFCALLYFKSPLFIVFVAPIVPSCQLPFNLVCSGFWQTDRSFKIFVVKSITLFFRIFAFGIMLRKATDLEE